MYRRDQREGGHAGEEDRIGLADRHPLPAFGYPIHMVFGGEDAGAHGH